MYLHIYLYVYVHLYVSSTKHVPVSLSILESVILRKYSISLLISKHIVGQQQSLIQKLPSLMRQGSQNMSERNIILMPRRLFLLVSLDHWVSPMEMTCFVDADHAGCHETRRSHTGIMILLQKLPIVWYSKRQNSVEGSLFGSEFVATKTAVEQLEAL